ncbi:MAG TPA: ATP synthase F0 subunit A [Bacteroidales bacterium]|jgi:F-type H+-transporting ATPase subunit a|nr:ATP synthase F0 subunit A [Bacteroidales bacterium]
MHKVLFRLFFTSILVINLQNFSFGNEEHEKKDSIHNEETAVEKFNPGNFIFDHIKDNYSWHLYTYKGNHVAIPLPVILYTKTRGIGLFWSSKLAHGHTYKGFKIAHEGDYKDKIIEVNEQGEFLSRPLDISITKNVAAIMISGALLILIFVSIANSYKRREDQAPKGIQSLLEPLILFIRDDVARNSIGEKHYERYTPFLLTIFFFILINNLMGLIPIFPGGANVTGNITVTLALALFTFIITTFTGNKNYWKHIFNPPGVPWWLKLPVPLIPFIELIGVIIKPFVLMIRLFANISAGHIIVLGFFSLIFIFGNMKPVMGFAVSPISIAFTIFMSFLELLVAFIQAYVFTMLSAIYFGMATEEHHE